jgi:hypothetical protein
MTPSFAELAESLRQLVGTSARVDVIAEASRIDINPFAEHAADVSVYDEGHGFHLVTPGLDVDIGRDTDEVARVVAAIAGWGVSSYDWYPIGTFTVSESPGRASRRKRRLVARLLPWSDSPMRDDMEPVSTLTWGVGR